MDNPYWLSASAPEVAVASATSNQTLQQIPKPKETDLSAMLAQPMVNFANIFGNQTSTNGMIVNVGSGIPSLNQLSIPVTTQLQKRTTVLPLATGLHGMSGLNQLAVPNQVIQVPSNGQQFNGLVNTTTVIPSLSFPTSTHHQVAKNFIQQAAAASGLVSGTAISNQQDGTNMISVPIVSNPQQGTINTSSMVNLRPTTTLHVTNLHTPFHCVQCNEIFENDGQLSYHTFVNHAQLQSRPHKCLSCPESFIQEHHLRDHMRAVHLSEDHGGGAPYTCSECQATFSSGGHLNYHIYMAHTLQGPKPQQHICSACGKSFIKANLLQAHIRNVHNGESFEANTASVQNDRDINTMTVENSMVEAKTHKCESCEKCFKTASYLKQHITSVHHKPLKCSQCGKGFGRKSDLKRHIRGVHVRDRPHMCKKCGWTFTESGNLKHHMKSVHKKEKEFRCSYCPKTFSLSSYLRTHLMRMHNVTATVDVNNNNDNATNTQADNVQEIAEVCSTIQLNPNMQTTTNLTQMSFIPVAIPQTQVQVNRCYECGQTFHTTQLLQNHVMNSHAQPFWCTVCGEGFSLASELQIHLQVKHTTTGQMNTSIMVPVNTMSLSQMQQTAVTTNEMPPQPTTTSVTTNETVSVTDGRCNLCNLSVGKSVKNHICPAIKYQHAAVACAAAYAMADERPHLCTECGKGFKTATNLKQHVRCVHSQERPHKCTNCTKSFSRMSDLKRHVKGVHQKLKTPASNVTLKCGECGLTFTESLDLKRHIYKTHLRGKPGFKCADCQEAFGDEASFQAHICHEEDRPHVCDICSKRFIMATQLRRHIRSAHSKTSEVPEVHKCFDCNHEFGRSVDLERHIQAVHRKEKPHKCSICGKCFGLQGNLNKHVRAVHLLEKPHQCIECGKRFAHIGVLKRHLKDIHFYDKRANSKQKKSLRSPQSNQLAQINNNENTNVMQDLTSLQTVNASQTSIQLPPLTPQNSISQPQTLITIPAHMHEAIPTVSAM